MTRASFRGPSRLCYPRGLVIRVVAMSGILLALGLQASEAAAQQEDPRPRAALGACAAGDVKKGIAILAELYAETRNPSFVFNQARCYQQNGELEAARLRFDEYLRVGKDEPPADIQRAQGFIKEIDDTLARRPPVAPVVTTPSPAAPAAPEPGPAPSEGRASYFRVTGFVLTALGVVAVGAGVYLSMKVQSTSQDVEKRFANMAVVTDPASLQRELSDGGRYETWQWVSYGIGVAALAGAATTFALSGFRFSSAHAPEQASVSLAPVFAPGHTGGTLLLRF